MDRVFKSSAQFISQPLDCRRLTLSLQFHQLPKERILELAETVMEWVIAFTEEKFVFRWYYNMSSAQRRFIFPKVIDIFNKDNYLSVGYEAYPINPVISDYSSMRNYQNWMQTVHPVYMFAWDLYSNDWDVALDYPRYFDERFPMQRPDRKQIIDLVSQVFNEEGKVFRTLHMWTDLDGGFCAYPYESNSELFYGTANISFGAFCIGDYINKVSESFSQLATNLSAAFLNLNAHVFLQPAELGATRYRSPYMKYFGKHLKSDGSNDNTGYSAKEWYPTYYLCGVEWFNLLSPLTAKHLESSPLAENRKSINTQKMPWGAAVVKSSKRITEYDVSDALELKRVLKPALYPGTSHRTLRGMFPWQDTQRIYSWCPRCKWEIVPIEKHEIEIVGSDLVYDITNSATPEET